MPRVKSSRRPAGLKSTDYDHEIALVDHDAAATPTGSVTPEPHNITRYSTTSRLLDLEEEHEEEQQQNRDGQDGGHKDPSSNTPNNAQANEHDDSHTEGETETRPSSNRVENGQPSTPTQTRPSIEVQGQYAHDIASQIRLTYRQNQPPTAFMEIIRM
jgi:hypothetical protein